MIVPQEAGRGRLGVLGRTDLRPPAHPSDSLFPPTCAGDIVLLQELVVSAGTHSPSWDGEAEGTAAPIIHAARVVTWRNRCQIWCLAHLEIDLPNPCLRDFCCLSCLFIFLYAAYRAAAAGGASGVSLNLAKRKNKISSEIQNLSAVLVRRAWRVQCDPPKKTMYQQVNYWPKQR